MTDAAQAETKRLAAELAGILRESSARDVRSRAGAPVWDIRVPGLLSYLFGGRQRTADVEATRNRILQAIQESRDSILMTHQDPPTDDDVPGTWTPVDWCYRLPTDVDLLSRDARSWLQLGGWTMFQTTEAPADWNPRILRRSPDEILAWMRSQQVSVFVDSFLDDLEWTIAIDPDST